MWREHQLTLTIGDDIDIDEFLSKLVNMGYRRECSIAYW